jgi:3-hydroxyisobutyrate dehydrogenase-like beta-hydroxyacid dehydrogenase
MMIGGDRDTCDALEPVLAAIASRRFLLGPPGSGARAKLATNLLLGLNRAALAEALVFAQTLGLDLPMFSIWYAPPRPIRAPSMPKERK